MSKGRPIRVRITGDVHNPKSIMIADADTGQAITNVLEVDIHASSMPSECTVTLKLWGCELDVTGTVQPQVKDGALVTSELQLE